MTYTSWLLSAYAPTLLAHDENKVEVLEQMLILLSGILSNHDIALLGDIDAWIGGDADSRSSVNSRSTHRELQTAKRTVNRVFCGLTLLGKPLYLHATMHWLWRSLRALQCYTVSHRSTPKENVCFTLSWRSTRDWHLSPIESLSRSLKSHLFPPIQRQPLGIIQLAAATCPSRSGQPCHLGRSETCQDQKCQDQEIPWERWQSPEMLKCGGKPLLSALFSIFMNCFSRRCLPEDFRDTNVITVYKNKNDLGDCKN